jgi:polyphosphate glucokinase
VICLLNHKERSTQTPLFLVRDDLSLPEVNQRKSAVRSETGKEFVFTVPVRNDKLQSAVHEALVFDGALDNERGWTVASRVHWEEQAMKAAPPAKSHRVLVIDVGGTNIKLLATGQREPRKIPSGPSMTARKMVRVVKDGVRDWKFDRISLGYPGPIINGHPLREPHNLGGGWVGFNFQKAFGHPVKVINDAAMQALGSYQGGRMLFLGLGTGLGSAMIVDGALEPMELAHLAYKNGKTYEDYLGLRGLVRYGTKKWRRHVAKVAKKLKTALEADYVVLGGGNSKKLKKLPPGVRLGRNENAFLGGFRMWQKQGATE